MNNYTLSLQALQDISEIITYITQFSSRPIAEGIEVVRVVSGYRDIETLFSSQDED